MHFTSLPYDYLQHLDRHDRGRRLRAGATGSRVRRGIHRTSDQ